MLKAPLWIGQLEIGGHLKSHWQSLEQGGGAFTLFFTFNVPGNITVFGYGGIAGGSEKKNPVKGSLI